jgi:hypothetical protein
MVIHCNFTCKCVSFDYQNCTTGKSFCWPTLLKYFNCPLWRWPFKGSNMLELCKVVIKWWFNHISVCIAQCLIYQDRMFLSSNMFQLTWLSSGRKLWTLREVNQVYRHMPSQVCSIKVLSDHPVAERVGRNMLAQITMQWCLTTSVSFVDYSITILNVLWMGCSINVLYIRLLYHVLQLVSVAS